MFSALRAMGGIGGGGVGGIVFVVEDGRRGVTLRLWP